MRKREIYKTVRLILADTFDMPIEDIKAESCLADQLGIDSFGMIEVGFALEQAFHTKILNSEKPLPKIVTVKDLVGCLYNIIREGASK